MSQEVGVEEVKGVQSPGWTRRIRSPGWIREEGGKCAVGSGSLVQPPWWVQDGCRGKLRKKMDWGRSG